MAFSKKIKFLFAFDADFEAAKNELDSNYPHLRTTHSVSGNGTLLFIESTLSFIYDSLIESLMKKYGGVKI